ncbi:hypothetical protein SASPL_123725 [Salvia splendens]|uniref:Peptidase S8/S53 domain-containing protein n=1 Tax=Salvia splendens TaxID=180675 RepID=A0A8X8XQU0_SALSN|nr:hypothetical protein SASPL_123725 [Salvia splendens]
METKPGFVSARLERKISLHTTNSPNFVGLHQNTGFWQISRYGRGVIIGVLDTGILPEHPSFSDEGMPPPPAKWKGKCEFNHTSCNNKIIGARTFTTSGDTPLDEDGHGTDTASTAAGRFVKGANIFGNANGTAVGIAPMAHLAIYKVCALSLNLHDDPIALGAYSAMEKGILVSCSAGNSGHSNFSLSKEAPWILTVGASTIDRKIRATAVLGNNLTFDGESAFQPADFPATQLPLVYAGMLNATDSQIRFCGEAIAVKNSGGAAMILVNPVAYGNLTLSEAHVLLATHVCYADRLKIKAYINSTAAAAIVFKGTVIGDDRAPMVAAFSSRGPNFTSLGILKPDILGPRVNILAAWPVSVENDTSTRSATFNMISGTSMSCPHLSGVAAL